MRGLPPVGGWTDVLELAELEYRARKARHSRRVFGGGLPALSTIQVDEHDIVERCDVIDRARVIDRADTLVGAGCLEPSPSGLLEEADIVGWSDCEPPEHEPPPPPAEVLDDEGWLEPPIVDGLTASLETIGLVELLQLLERGRCSGTIYIEARSGCGSVEVQEGQVSAAWVLCRPAAGELLEVATVPGDQAAEVSRIVEAVRQMVPWCSGQVQYTPRRTAPRGNRAALPIQQLLMDALMG